MSDEAARTIPGEMRACAVCGLETVYSTDSVIGPVCPGCWSRAAPESAPYYADWERAGERYYADRERQARKSQQATKLKVVRQ